jgi:hypothetical protein
MSKDLVKQNNNVTLYSPEFIERVQQLKKDMHKFYTDIGEEATPLLDSEGRKIVDRRPDGKNYIIEAYMRKKLDQYFPGWSLEMAQGLHFLGAEWVVAQVKLCIIDEHLIAFGIIPPMRIFYGVDSVRIQFKKDQPHTPENIIDVGDNCKQAVSAAFKYAINRLTNIGDDIYGKRMDLEGAGNIDTIMSNVNTNDTTAQKMFNDYCSNKKIRPSVVFKILNISDYSEITDYKEAYKKIKASTE